MPSPKPARSTVAGRPVICERCSREIPAFTPHHRLGDLRICDSCLDPGERREGSHD